jgi:hypothetical protein
MNKKRRVLGLGMGVVLLIIAGLVWAQPPQGGQQGGRQRGNFDPAQMMERMADMMKERLEATDDEWKIIGPRLTKVMTLGMQSRGGGRGMMGMFGGRGGRGGPGGDRGGNQNRQLTGVAKVADELRVAVEANASAEQLKSKLTALRKAREKAKAELAKAQLSLKQVLSLKQECLLVMMGTLE